MALCLRKHAWFIWPPISTDDILCTIELLWCLASPIVFDEQGPIIRHALSQRRHDETRSLAPNRKLYQRPCLRHALLLNHLDKPRSARNGHHVVIGPAFLEDMSLFTAHFHPERLQHR